MGVDDQSEAGCYLTDSELHGICTTIQANKAADDATKDGTAARSVPSSARQDLVRNVFQLCDQDRDNRLDVSEMYRFATHTGYEGGAEQWTKDFKQLCKDLGADPIGMNITD